MRAHVSISHIDILWAGAPKFSYSDATKGGYYTVQDETKKSDLRIELKAAITYNSVSFRRGLWEIKAPTGFPSPEADYAPWT